MQLTQGVAILLVLTLAAVVVSAATYFFLPFSFPWLAWCALGYGLIVTLGRELITVRDLNDEAALGTPLSERKLRIAEILFSAPSLFITISVLLALLFASVDTFGLLATIGSLLALEYLVKHALRM
jgi:low affinity Fe/Cu permease